MLQAEPMAPTIYSELQTLSIRLAGLRENFETLANDFGVHLDQPDMPPTADAPPQNPGLDGLRTEITQINTQIALIEQLYDRLFAARTQLFGLAEAGWQETDTPLPHTPGNYGPVRRGDFRAH